MVSEKVLVQKETQLNKASQFKADCRALFVYTYRLQHHPFFTLGILALFMWILPLIITIW